MKLLLYPLLDLTFCVGGRSGSGPPIGSSIRFFKCLIDEGTNRPLKCIKDLIMSGHTGRFSPRRRIKLRIIVALFRLNYRWDMPQYNVVGPLDL